MRGSFFYQSKVIGKFKIEIPESAEKISYYWIPAYCNVIVYVKCKVFREKRPYFMHIYYGACPRAQQAGSAPTKEPQSGEIFVENTCRVI